MQREIVLYFDRYENKYFETFEEMRQYRRENAAAYLYVTSHINEVEINKRIYEVVDYLAEGNFDGIWPLVDEGCKASLTKEKREAWQQKLASLGVYKQITNIEVPLLEDDESYTQRVTVLVTAGFAEGEAEIELIINEELTVLGIEVK